jgi:hypothetical protein
VGKATVVNILTDQTERTVVNILTDQTERTASTAAFPLRRQAKTAKRRTLEMDE